MKTFADVIDCWPRPSPVSFAEDIGEEAGTCRQWRNRDALPSRVWRKTIAAANRRGIPGVTFELLAAIAERQTTEAVATSSTKGARAPTTTPASKSGRRRSSARGSPRAAA